MPVSSVVPDEPYMRSEGLDRLLGRIEPDVARLLGGVLEGREGRISMLLRSPERDLFR